MVCITRVRAGWRGRPRRLGAWLGAISLAALGSAPALAQTYDWSASGSGAPSGGTGTWDTTSARWTDNGGTSYGAWPNGTQTARFGATAGTVTLSGSISAGALQFTVDSYTLQDSTLTLGGLTPTVHVATAGHVATLTSELAGTSGFTKTGAGTFRLAGEIDNVITGQTTVSAGTLELGKTAGSTVALAGPLVITGGTVRWLEDDQLAPDGALTITSGLADVNDHLVFAGELSGAGGTLDMGPNGMFELFQNTDTTYAGVLAGNSFCKDGAGTLTLAGTTANTINGIDVCGGVLELNKPDGVDAVGGGIVLSAGTVRLLQANQIPDDAGFLFFEGTLDLNGLDDTIGDVMDFDLPVTREITLGGGNLTINQTFDGVFGGTISESGTFTKSGPGELILTGTASYDGVTTVNEGTLLINDTGLLDDQSSAVNVTGGATLGGTGTILRPVTITDGVLAPGDPLDLNDGPLTLGKDLTLGASADFMTELGGLAGGLEYDQVLVNDLGNATLGGTLSVTFDNTGWATGNDFLYILELTGSGLLSGLFSNYANGAQVGTYDGYNWFIYYHADAATNNLSGGNDVVITNVPEPGTLALVGLGAAGLWRRRRRR